MRSLAVRSLLCLAFFAAACNKGGFFFGSPKSGSPVASETEPAPGGEGDPAADPAAPPAPEAASAPADPIRCCVNKQYFSCPDAPAAAQCVGEPFDLMSCMDQCMSSDCENTCIEQYGP